MLVKKLHEKWGWLLFSSAVSVCSCSFPCLGVSSRSPSGLAPVYKEHNRSQHVEIIVQHKGSSLATWSISFQGGQQDVPHSVLEMQISWGRGCAKASLAPSWVAHLGLSLWARLWVLPGPILSLSWEPLLGFFQIGQSMSDNTSHGTLRSRNAALLPHSSQVENIFWVVEKVELSHGEWWKAKKPFELTSWH